MNVPQARRLPNTKPHVWRQQEGCFEGRYVVKIPGTRQLLVTTSCAGVNAILAKYGCFCQTKLADPAAAPA